MFGFSSFTWMSQGKLKHKRLIKPTKALKPSTSMVLKSNNERALYGWGRNILVYVYIMYTSGDRAARKLIFTIILFNPFHIHTIKTQGCVPVMFLRILLCTPLISLFDRHLKYLTCLLSFSQCPRSISVAHWGSLCASINCIYGGTSQRASLKTVIGAWAPTIINLMQCRAEPPLRSLS